MWTTWFSRGSGRSVFLNAFDRTEENLPVGVLRCLLFVLLLWTCVGVASQLLPLLKTDTYDIYLSLIPLWWMLSCATNLRRIVIRAADEWMSENVLLGGYPRKISFTKLAADLDLWRVLIRRMLRKREFAHNKPFSASCILHFDFHRLTNYRDASSMRFKIMSLNLFCRILVLRHVAVSRLLDIRLYSTSMFAIALFGVGLCIQQTVDCYSLLK